MLRSRRRRPSSSETEYRPSAGDLKARLREPAGDGHQRDHGGEAPEVDDPEVAQQQREGQRRRPGADEVAASAQRAAPDDPIAGSPRLDGALPGAIGRGGPFGHRRGHMPATR